MKKLKREQVVGANYHYTRYSFEYFVRSLQNLDLHAIELYAADPHLYVGDNDYAKVAKIKKLLREADVKIRCFTPENCVYPINIALEDETVRNRSIDYYYKTIEQAAELESPLVQIIGGRGYWDGDLKAAWDYAADSLGKIAGKAAKYGITMVLEASSYPTSTVIHNCQNIRDMIDYLHLDNFKAMIDTNAVYLAKENFADCVKLLGKDLIHMHFIDAKPGAICLIPGEGEMPMDEFMTILAENDYQGVLTPELWGNTYVADPEAALKRSIEFCYRYTE